MALRNKPQPVTRRMARETFVAKISGEQTAGDLVVPITDSGTFSYDTDGATDSGRDISRFFRAFTIQSSTTNGQNAQVQIAAVPGEWVTPPTSYSSDEAADASPGLITPGDMFMMRLPTSGVEVRLSVTQPVVATNFQITVLMSDSSEREIR